MPAAHQQQLPLEQLSLCCPCGSGELYRRGLCEPCYNRSRHSRRAYHRALDEFFSWYPSNAPGEGFTRAVLQRYRSHFQQRSLSAASINLHLAALKKLAAEAAAIGLIDPGTASAIASVSGARALAAATG